MKLRVFLLKPCPATKNQLIEYVEALGHDIDVIHAPQSCLSYHVDGAGCSVHQICTDAIVVGPGLDAIEGLRLLEHRRGTGCKGSVHNAIICRELTPDEESLAASIGCCHLELPLQYEAVAAWLADVERQVPEHRTLSRYTVWGNGKEM